MLLGCAGEQEQWPAPNPHPEGPGVVLIELGAENHVRYGLETDVHNCTLPGPLGQEILAVLNLKGQGRSRF